MCLVTEDGAHVILACKIGHLLRLRRGDPERLLAVDVLARAQRRHDDLVVIDRANAAAHHVDLGKFAQHALDAVERVRHAEVLCRDFRGFHARRANRHHIVEVRQRLQCR